MKITRIVIDYLSFQTLSIILKNSVNIMIVPIFQILKKNYRSYYDRVYSMLRGTYVKMFVINRTPNESRDSMNFWKDFFVATNAKNPVPDIEYIGK